MQFPVQKRPGRQNHGFRAELLAEFSDNPGDPAVFQQKRTGGPLTDLKIGLKLHFPFHRFLVTHFVALGAGRPDGGPFSKVQETELERRGIRDTSHRSAERINLTDDVSFRDPADRRVAAHLCNMVQIDRKHQRGRARSCGSQCGFTCGMAAAHHDNIKIFSAQNKSPVVMQFIMI